MNHEDHRVITTKKFLKKALISLLKENHLSKINIKKLCEAAEINRATFYSHYKDVSDLFNEIINEFMGEITEFIATISDSKGQEERAKLFLNMIEYIDRYSDLFVLIFENSNSMDSANEQYRALSDKISAKFSDSFDRITYSSYVTEYLYHAGGSILYNWIKNNKKETYEELSYIMLNLIMQGYSFVLKNR